MSEQDDAREAVPTAGAAHPAADDATGAALLAELAAQMGFECVGVADAAALQVNPEVRAMCAADRCRAYGRNWRCPPHCGDLDAFAADIAAHERCVVAQTVWQLEDEFDVEGMMEAEAQHKRRFTALAEAIRATLGPEAADLLFLGAGTCTLCPTCSCPDEPCRRPDEAVTSMEAAGLLVSDVCEAAAIPYNHGPRTIAYTSCVLG